MNTDVHSYEILDKKPVLLKYRAIMPKYHTDKIVRVVDVDGRKVAELENCKQIRWMSQGRDSFYFRGYIDDNKVMQIVRLG